jgi:hypothetical protein
MMTYGPVIYVCLGGRGMQALTLVKPTATTEESILMFYHYGLHNV